MRVFRGLLLAMSWVALGLTLYWTYALWNRVGLDVDIAQMPIGPWLLVLSLCEWFGINLNLTYLKLFGLPGFVEEAYRKELAA